MPVGDLESSVSALQRRSATVEAAVQTDPVEELFVSGVGLGVCVLRPRWNGSGLPPSQASVTRAPLVFFSGGELLRACSSCSWAFSCLPLPPVEDDRRPHSKL